MYKFLYVILILSVFFINSIRTVLNIDFLHLIVVLILSLLSIRNFKLYKYLIPYNLIIIITFLINLFFGSSTYDNLVFSLIQYLLIVNLIPVIINQKSFNIEFFSNTLIFFGCFLLAGGYIHYFGNYNIGGLIQEPIWSELENYSHVRYRMVSFITSPQNYSAITFTVFIISISSKARNQSKLSGW